MNPLAGLTAVFSALSESMAFEEKKRTDFENAGEFSRAADLERKNASATRMRGAAAAGRQRMAGSALASNQRLAYAMGNIDAGSGTAAQTMESSAIFSELDAQTLQNNAVRAAFGHEESARKYAAESKRLTGQYWIGGADYLNSADAAFDFKLASSALSSAVSFGAGGK